MILASLIEPHMLLQLLRSTTAASLWSASFALTLHGFSNASAARRAGRATGALIHRVATALLRRSHRRRIIALESG